MTAFMQTDPLHAVYDDDLRKLLGNLGVLDQFDAGLLKCRFCGEVITEKNLNAIFPDNNEVALVCDKPECNAQLNLHMTSLENAQSPPQTQDGE